MSTYVYRAFDRADRLLYIGVTKNLGTRMRAHWRTCSAWWPHASVIRFEAFEADVDARIAERLAIMFEYPIFNVYDRGLDHPDGPVNRLRDVVYEPPSALLPVETAVPSARGS